MHWHFKPEAPFFILDPEGDGLTYFETAAERDTAAAELIKNYLDADGWGEGVEYLVAGTITHRATETNRQDRPADLDEDGIDGEGVWWGPDVEYRCGYQMLPVPSVEAEL